MNEPPTPAEAMESLTRLEQTLPVTMKRSGWQWDYMRVRDFVQHHERCQEKEASLVLSMEEVLDMVPLLEDDEEIPW